MTTRLESEIEWSQTFNSENRLAGVSNGENTWTFVYDGDGNRVKQVNPDGSITLLLGGGIYMVEDATGDPEITKYYSIAGQRVAMESAEGLQFLLTDHLGSVAAVTNSAGGLLSEQRYLPFGAERLTPDIGETDFGFTGQRDLAAVGLMDYNARFYSPGLGRFASADSIVPQLFRAQSLNRFAYVENNPLNFIDPSGHGLCSSIDGTCLNTSPTPSTGGGSSGGGTGTGGSTSGGTTSGGTSRSKSTSSIALKEDLLLGSTSEIAQVVPTQLCGPTPQGMRICFVLMPPGASPAVGDFDPALASGADILGPLFNGVETLTTGLGKAFLHSGLELAETLASVVPPWAITLAVVDVGVTAVGCINEGECYYGSPGAGLPKMLVADQDMAVTLTDLVVGTAGYPFSGPTVDAITSAGSVIYDYQSAIGAIPNHVSFGVAPSTLYVLIYQ
jgi:RHS repeat-associated protein